MKKVEVVRQNRILPIGSVCNVLKEKKDYYEVEFCSMYGTYNYTIPKNITEEVKKYGMDKL